MLERIILLSGSISSGKSTLANALSKRYDMTHISTRQLLTERLGHDAAALDREALQNAGDQVDTTSRGRWIAEEISHGGFDGSIIVDSVRTQQQIDAIRTAFGRRVIHIHLQAPLQELERRYRRRRRVRKGELKRYEDVRKNRTEAAVDELSGDSDIVIDTARSTPEDVIVRAASRLGLYGPRHRRLVDVLVGGQYGSEGKGNVAAYLAHEYDLLVRVGGPNAGHKVATERGAVYTQHHLPSGTSTSQAQLLLGPGAVINPNGLLKEIAESGVDVERLTIDPGAMIISARDVRDEQRLVKTIGSTGQGVGFATARRIRERYRHVDLARNIPALKPYLRPAREILDDAFARGLRVFLEGTQGTALSLYHGDYPYVTSRDTSASGCLAETGIAASRVRKIVLVCRTYPIRVASPEGSTSGSMSQPISWAEIARRSRKSYNKILATEHTSTTGRRRRVGEFDWALLQKAGALNGPTDIALTFSDYLDVDNGNARRFEQLTEGTIQFIEEVERVAGAPVTLISTGFHYRSIIDRRSW